MSAKNTTFAAKFNKKLADKRHKKDCRSSLFLYLVEKFQAALPRFKVSRFETAKQ